MNMEQRITTFLDANRTRWSQIAAEAGIDRSWPYKYMAGKIPNPTHRTFEKLDAVIRRDRRQKNNNRSSTPPQ